MMFLIVVRICLILLAFRSISAQELYTYPIPDAAQLPSREVYEIQQDTKGFIWIAGDAGIHKYDGIRFQEWIHPQYGRQSVSDLQIGPVGTIFCKDFNGRIFKVEGDTLAQIAHIVNTDPSGACYTLDEEDNIWYILDKNLIQINKHGKLLHTVSLQKIIQSVYIIDLLYHDKSIFWLDRSGNVGRYYLTDQKLEVIPAHNKITPYAYITLLKSNHTIYRILKSDQYYWDDILRPEIKAKPIPIPKTHGRIHTIQSYQNMLFFNTGNGVYVFEMDKSEIKYDAHFLKKYNVSWTFKDNENHYWFATLQDGIWISPGIDYTLYNSFPNTRITALKRNDSNLLFAGNYSGEVYRIPLNTDTYEVLPILNQSERLAVKKIYTTHNKLYVLRGITDIYHNLSTHPKSIKARNIRAMHIGNNQSHVLFPDHLQSCSIDALNEIEDIKSPENTLPGGYDVFCNDKKEECYYALTTGLFYKKGRAWKEIRVNEKAVITKSISGSGDTVYVYTPHSGFLMIHEGDIRHIHIPNRQENYKIVLYSGGHLFAASHNVLAQFKVQYTDNKIGIQEINRYNIQDITALESDPSYIFISTGQGIIQIPVSNTNKPIKPEFLITSIRVGSMLKDHSKSIWIAANQNAIEIQYQVAAYSNRRACTLEYQTLEQDTGWHSADAGNGVLYIAALPSGKNTLRLRARNHAGLVSETSTLHFDVETPIHKSPWLYLVLSSLAAIILFGGSRYRIQQIKQQENLKVRTARSQLAALKSQMNPHFIFNALNSLQAYILKKDIQESNRFLSRFSQLMRDILQNSGNIFIPLEKEINIVKAYLEIEKVRFDNCFTWSIKLENIENTNTLQIPAMIIQPLVENAVKYGINPAHQNNYIHIHIEMKEMHVLQIDIEDSGNPESEKTKNNNQNNSDYISFGLTSIQQRLRLLEELTGITCKFTYRPADQNSGTQVSLSFPIHIPLSHAFQSE
jgi:hypothetical protein